MTRAELLAFVGDGIARAARYGIVSERDVCKFFNLVAVFGPDFDTKLSWVNKTVMATDGPALRLDRLYARAIRVADGEQFA